MRVTVNLWRQNDPDEADGDFQTFEVEAGADWSVHNLLQHLQRTEDPSIAYYIACKLGLCAACWARVNGKQVLTCTTPLEAEMTIEPAKNYRVVRDVLIEPRTR